MGKINVSNLIKSECLCVDKIYGDIYNATDYESFKSLIHLLEQEYNAQISSYTLEKMKEIDFLTFYFVVAVKREFDARDILYIYSLNGMLNELMKQKETINKALEDIEVVSDTIGFNK